MNRMFSNMFYALLFISILLSGCAKDENPVISDEYDFASLINDYTDKVVIATYSDLKNKTEALKEKQKQSEQELENLFQSLMQRAFKGELVK